MDSIWLIGWYEYRIVLALYQGVKMDISAKICGYFVFHLAASQIVDGWNEER
jgi:hypothetical protein